MLRKIRIALAALFFIGITLLFVGIGQQWWGWMAKLQFLPSCLALNFAVIAGVLLLTILFGRIYCSVICPMGVFQDVVMYIRREGGLLLNKIQVKKLKEAKAKGEKPGATVLKPYVKHFGYVKERKVVRYSVLALTILAIVIGTQFFVALIAPYSAYGRMVRTFAGLVEGQSILPDLLYAAAITFVVIVFCAWTWGRAWCNVICPVGTTLGLFSRFSLFRPVIDTEKCNGCGRCYRGCKGSCIDGEHHKIDYSRCVDCFDCIRRCKGDAIHYKFVGFGGPKAKAEAKPEAGHDDSRRAFIATSLFAVAALATETRTGKLMAAPKAKAPEKGRIVPPGAISEKNFYDHCTACQLCVSNCTGGVLRASGDLEHFLQPQLDYTKGFCQPDCNVCSTLCPAGAILPLTLEQKRRTKIGVARVDTDTCAGCGKCERRCPEGAITMESGRPVIDTAKCIGCGACEFSCPVKPVKAIQVTPLSLHIKL